MHRHRREVLRLAASAAALAALPRTARAENYPARPVRLIVGYPAGGSTDLVARIIGAWLSDRLGQSFDREINAGLSDARIAARLAEVGGRPILVTADEFGAMWQRDTEKWTRVVKFAAGK
jgi:tripartite-type tricarboxylate transporter receptor subunit TctC